MTRNRPECLAVANFGSSQYIYKFSTSGSMFSYSSFSRVTLRKRPRAQPAHPSSVTAQVKAAGCSGPKTEMEFGTIRFRRRLIGKPGTNFLAG
jgi:hypothetical protein